MLGLGTSPANLTQATLRPLAKLQTAGFPTEPPVGPTEIPPVPGGLPPWVAPPDAGRPPVPVVAPVAVVAPPEAVVVPPEPTIRIPPVPGAVLPPVPMNPRAPPVRAPPVAPRSGSEIGSTSAVQAPSAPTMTISMESVKPRPAHRDRAAPPGPGHSRAHWQGHSTGCGGRGLLIELPSWGSAGRVQHGGEIERDGPLENRSCPAGRRALRLPAGCAQAIPSGMAWGVTGGPEGEEEAAGTSADRPRHCDSGRPRPMTGAARS